MKSDIPFTFFISYRRPFMIVVALLLKDELERRFRHVRVIIDEQDTEGTWNQEYRGNIGNLIEIAHATILLVDSNWMPKCKNELQIELHESDIPFDVGPIDCIIQEVTLSQTLPLSEKATNSYNLISRRLIPVFIDCPPTFKQFLLPAALKSLADLEGEQIEYKNWSASIGFLLDQLAVRSNLRPLTIANPASGLDKRSIDSKALSLDELTILLSFKDYEGWYIDTYGDSQSQYLVKKFKFNNFEEASDFWTQASAYCRLLDHHPDWRNTHQFVSVALNTWEAKKLVTHLDLNLALIMNRIEASILRTSA
jgi:4a-hydroxytetrahydrobiopterin dehydratase